MLDAIQHLDLMSCKHKIVELHTRAQQSPFHALYIHVCISTRPLPAFRLTAAPSSRPTGYFRYLLHILAELL